MTGAPQELTAMTEPIDETQPHPTADSGTASTADSGTASTADSGTATGPDTEAGAAAGTGTAADPPLRADPDRPSDSRWREPAWFPPRDRTRHRDRGASPFAIVVGLIFIVIGAYYFLDRTLGIAMPRIQWASVWPIALIVIGGLILIRSLQHRA
jgi:hypothetical protein